MPPKTRSVPLALALAVALVACGDDGGATVGDASASDGSPSDAGTAPDGAPASADGAAGDGGAGDEHLPWAGGPAYYDRWENGPSSDPGYFPIAVWLQSPSRAEWYRTLGINLYIGLWEGPTGAQLTALDAAGMPVACDQNEVGLAHRDDATLVAWTQQDEPDNAQPDGSGGWLPCVEPSVVVSRYEEWTAADPTRPVYLNLGRGVSDEEWVGRGSCTGRLDMYEDYIAGADIVSFDIYPVNSGQGLEYVPRGVDRLREYAGYEKPVWVWIECTRIRDGGARPTPHQVRAEVWMALVHGARGIGYFMHEFDPFQEAGLTDDPEMQAAVGAINARITELAPVLNTPSIANGVTVESSNVEVPVDTLLKRFGGETYLFAVAMRDAATTATFTLRGVPDGARVEVLGEDRALEVVDGAFSDDFPGYGVHLYRIAP